MAPYLIVESTRIDGANLMGFGDSNFYFIAGQSKVLPYPTI